LNIRERRPEDEPAVAPFLRENHSERVARFGELLRPLDHPALIAERDGELAGVLTYVPGDDSCEILTLHAAEQWGGIGTALLEAVEQVARGRLWLVTTNDNVDALRFYQRRGFRLERVNAGAVDEARERLKPEIPVVGNYGIPIRDEIVLVRG
jgi:GNAT superfamily N-acetyltransferase